MQISSEYENSTPIKSKVKWDTVEHDMILIPIPESFNGGNFCAWNQEKDLNDGWNESRGMENIF